MTRKKRKSYFCSSYLPSHYNRDFFIIKASKFIDKTSEHVLQGINPGGIYQATWCRDAAYILKDWFLSGNIDGTIQQIYQIWSHQITSQGAERIVYGRGSPEADFTAKLATAGIQRKFEGALPTTIYQTGFLGIYGMNPDIDSTALMIATTSWILARYIKNEENIQQQKGSLFKGSLLRSFSSPSHSKKIVKYPPDYFSSILSRVGTMTNALRVFEFTIPRMLKAIEYLNSRDFDDDGLSEQNHNEDWMDTALRAGKVVYSQACWLLALNDLSSLLTKLGMYKDAAKLKQMTYKAVHGVEQKLWSEQDGCYIDLQKSEDSDKEPYRLLTQDVSCYLIAISQNTASDSLAIHSRLQHHYKKEKQKKKERESNHCCQR